MIKTNIQHNQHSGAPHYKRVYTQNVLDNNQYKL
jgi:hypothetical protein